MEQLFLQLENMDFGILANTLILRSIFIDLEETLSYIDPNTEIET